MNNIRSGRPDELRERLKKVTYDLCPLTQKSLRTVDARSLNYWRIKMIRAAICDDNLNIANSIENSVMDMDIKGLSCDVFSSGIELIKHLQSEQISYNIYLMDIEMPL